MSYIINNFRVPEPVKNVVEKLTVGLNIETYQLFVHILFGHLTYIKKTEGWLPVSAVLMLKEWKGKAEWEVLAEMGLIELRLFNIEGEVQDYSKKYGISREFRIAEGVLDEIMDAYPKDISEMINATYYNLMTGKKMNVVKRHKVKDANNNPIPPLIKNSILNIESSLINGEAIRSSLDSDEAEVLFGGGNKGRLINNKHCFNKILSGSKDMGNGYVEYQPSYEVQMSGRISEIGGGIQSLSRDKKALAFKDVMGVHNYDLKSSQVNGLIQWFELAGLDTSWLINYLSVDKQVFADLVGISKDCWKRCFMALIMGGKPPTQKEMQEAIIDGEVNIDLITRDIGQYLLEAALGDTDLMMEYLNRFEEVVTGLRIELDKWHNYLIGKHLEIPGVSSYSACKKKHVVTNATGMTFNLSDYKTEKGKWKKINDLKRRLAAFWLQGTEAAFIHHLTVVSEYYDYRVMNNEHDGVVTIGTIPSEAIDYAKEKSGLKYAVLEEKPFN